MVSSARNTVAFLGKAALFFSAMLTSGIVVAAPPAQTQATIPILQPLGGMTSGSVGVGNTFDTLPIVEYFREAIVWIQLTAVGFCVLWVVISGIQIMVSAGGSGLESAKEHMKWGLIGLIMLFFMGFILQSLNSLFYA